MKSLRQIIALKKMQKWRQKLLHPYSNFKANPLKSFNISLDRKLQFPLSMRGSQAYLRVLLISLVNWLATASLTAPVASPVAQPEILHSRPTAKAKIFLSFNAVVTTEHNTK